jgi:tetratricopeptide (TPR) repeat protein|tara:strand:+ start:9670 stop:9978 length:309 start_codon:yes stop_codon:yes gene_type:complete
MPSIEQLTRLLEAEPNDPFLLYGVAQEHLKAGDLDAAVAWFDRTIAADPAHAYAYFHKARALETAERTEDAVATLREGVRVARAAGDQKALSELSGYLDELE